MEINDKTEKKLEETFKVLSNTNRLKIIHLLANEKKEITVNEIAKKIKITQPAASQHLKVLKTAEIIKSNKEGNKIYYTINMTTMTKEKESIDLLFYKILKKSN